MTWTDIDANPCTVRRRTGSSVVLRRAGSSVLAAALPVNAGFGSRPPVRNREPVADGG
ncbi:hypothetical protein [Actinoplanes sp. NPDC051859]|uniref:hypothetical protein n=1 Tax=Actinoplanes sp. NPDC051859 TaxID=3363909 RepID=UPI00378AB9BA